MIHCLPSLAIFSLTIEDIGRSRWAKKLRPSGVERRGIELSLAKFGAECGV